MLTCIFFISLTGMWPERVSNMTPKIWNEWIPKFESLPAVNQVECNPFFQQRELRDMLEQSNVKIEAYQPLGHGDTSLLSQIFFWFEMELLSLALPTTGDFAVS